MVRYRFRLVRGFPSIGFFLCVWGVYSLFWLCFGFGRHDILLTSRGRVIPPLPRKARSSGVGDSNTRKSDKVQSIPPYTVGFDSAFLMVYDRDKSRY